MRTTTPSRTSESPTSTASELFLLGLGSNAGASTVLLRWALTELDRRFGPFAVAPIYRSAPISPIPQPHFLNTVLLRRGAAADLPDPEEVLAVAKALELAAGRRPGPRLAPRPLDVDLLLCGSRRSERPELTLPHPCLGERRFVLAPLADLEPDLVLPGGGPRVVDRLAALEGQEVERLAPLGAL